MDRLTRYVYTQCIGLSLIVTLSLAGAFWLVQSLRLIELAVDRGIGVGTFMELLLLSLPQILQLVLPLAIFFGILFSYNRLIGDSELIVMRACGVSQWQLARPALYVALTGTLIMLVLSIVLLPASRNAFKDLQFRIRSEFTAGVLQEGAFTTISDRLTVYVRARSADALRGLLLEDRRDPEKPGVYTAESGLVTQINGAPAVLMLNGTHGVWDKDRRTLSMLAFDSYTLDLGQFRDAAAARVLEPDERYLPDLFYPHDADQDIVLRRHLMVEGHNRLLAPFACISFAAVALASLLTGQLDRRGQTKRMLIAIGTVLALEVATLGITNVAIREPGAIALIYLVMLGPIAGSLIVSVASDRRASMLALRRRPA